MQHHSERYPDFDWPSVEMVINLLYTYEVVNAVLVRKTEKHGISPGAFNVLMILSRCDEAGCQMSELGDLLLVTRANITGLVDCLVAKGFVARFDDPRDRRVRLVRLTDAGQAFLESILPAHYSRMREMLVGMSDAEKRGLSKMLTKLRRTAQDSQLGEV